MIIDIIGGIYTQKPKATDQYSSSYGLTSFVFKTRNRNIKLRWAITRWILVRCRRFLRGNEAYDVGYSSIYHTESTHQYWRRYGPAGFSMRNQPCLHTKINNFVETWHFLIILLFYYRFGIYLIHCKLLYPKTKRKVFIFPPSHGIPPKCEKIVSAHLTCITHTTQNNLAPAPSQPAPSQSIIVIVIVIVIIDIATLYSLDPNSPQCLLRASKLLFVLLFLMNYHSPLSHILFHFFP